MKDRRTASPPFKNIIAFVFEHRLTGLKTNIDKFVNILSICGSGFYSVRTEDFREVPKYNRHLHYNIYTG